MIHFVHYIWDTDNKTVCSSQSEVTSKGHSRSSAMSFFIRSPGLSISDRKVGNIIFQQNRLNDLEAGSRSLAMAQFNNHISLYNDGVVQAVTFAYLIYWWTSCVDIWRRKISWPLNLGYGSLIVRIYMHDRYVAEIILPLTICVYLHSLLHIELRKKAI